MFVHGSRFEIGLTVQVVPLGGVGDLQFGEIVEGKQWQPVEFVNVILSHIDFGLYVDV